MVAGAPSASTNISAVSNGARTPPRRRAGGSSSRCGDDDHGRFRSWTFAHLEAAGRPRSGQRRSRARATAGISRSRCVAATMSLRSYTLQLAVLTAASIAFRCFPGAVRAVVSPELAEAPLLLWPWLKLTLRRCSAPKSSERTRIAAGDRCSAEHVDLRERASDQGRAPRHFRRLDREGRSGGDCPRLPEREYFSAGRNTGRVAGAVGTISFVRRDQPRGHAPRRRDIAVAAGFGYRRPRGARHSRSSICRASFGCWAWGISAMPICGRLQRCPTRTRRRSISPLFDFDKVERENVETGIIFTPAA